MPVDSLDLGRWRGLFLRLLLGVGFPRAACTQKGPTWGGQHASCTPGTKGPTERQNCRLRHCKAERGRGRDSRLSSSSRISNARFEFMLLSFRTSSTRASGTFSAPARPAHSEYWAHGTNRIRDEPHARRARRQAPARAAPLADRRHRGRARGGQQAGKRVRRARAQVGHLQTTSRGPRTGSSGRSGPWPTAGTFPW